MSDIGKDVAMPAEENLDGESVSGQASQGTREGRWHYSHRKEENKKGEGEE